MEINLTIQDKTLAYALVTAIETHVGGWIAPRTVELVAEDQGALTAECRALIADDELSPLFVCPLIDGAGKIRLVDVEGATHEIGCGDRAGPQDHGQGLRAALRGLDQRAGRRVDRGPIATALGLWRGGLRVIDAVRKNRFAAGWTDGLDDRRRRTGRALDGEDPDYAAGYVAGKYKQVLCQKIGTYDQALEIWENGAN